MVKDVTFPSSRAEWQKLTWMGREAQENSFLDVLNSHTPSWLPAPSYSSPLLRTRSLLSDTVTCCWHGGRAVTAVAAGEGESCCVQQEMFQRTEWERQKVQSIPAKQDMNFNVEEKWSWLVDLKEMQKQTKTVAPIFYSYKRKWREKRNYFFCWWFGLCCWTPFKRFTTPNIILF